MQPALLGSLSRSQGDLVNNSSNSHPLAGETLRSQAPTSIISLLYWRSITTSSTAKASVKVSVPSLGESISDGGIAAILKQKGEHVNEDEVLMQIETDKVTIDVRAPTSGTVEAILVRKTCNFYF
jgi:2-oxoglutarate dehydrogenase E2 component (dihydrolipoamide succinyltransferase)